MQNEVDGQVKAELGPFQHVWHEQRGQNALYTTRHFKAGEAVSEFGSEATYPSPNMYTLQVSRSTHIDLSPPLLQYTNHSCEPTVFFDTAQRRIIALQDMQPGDQITFFYPSTEWAMDVPFDCCCGKPACLGRITGASRMDRAVLKRYRLNAHIQELLAQADAGADASAQ